MCPEHPSNHHLNLKTKTNVCSCKVRSFVTGYWALFPDPRGILSTEIQDRSTAQPNTEKTILEQS